MATQKILVVDDESEIRELLQEYLENLGYGVVSVGTGREALDLIQTGRLDVNAALIDWSIPGIEGRDVIQQIHEALPDCVLFAITGHNLDTVQKSSAGNLVAGIFRKPFSLRDLGQELARALR